MRYGRSMRAGLAGTVCLAAVTVSGSTGLARSAAPATARLAHSAPSWTAGASALRAAPASQRLAVRVFLAPRGGTAALNAAIRCGLDSRQRELPPLPDAGPVPGPVRPDRSDDRLGRVVAPRRWDARDRRRPEPAGTSQRPAPPPRRSGPSA